LLNAIDKRLEKNFVTEFFGSIYYISADVLSVKYILSAYFKITLQEY